MKKYTLEVTPEQLMVLSQALMAMETLAHSVGVREEICDQTYVNTFVVVSDKLNEYYDEIGAD